MGDNRQAIRLRESRASDRAAALALAQRLADFPVPEWRGAAEIVDGDLRALEGFFDAPLPGAALWVAEDDAADGAAGELLGIAYLEVARDYFTGRAHGHLSVLAVARSAEGRGVARRLLDACESWARERGFEKLTLNVFDRNTHARAVYEHVGYRPEAVKYVKLLG